MFLIDLDQLAEIAKNYIEIKHPKYIEVNIIDMLAKNCGWLPLVKDESMTVNIGNKEYIIKRTK